MDQIHEDLFAEFVRGHHARLFRIVYLLTGDYQRTEDVLQATYTKLCQRWRRVSSLADPGAYVTRMAVNEARSWWRRPSSREQPLLLIDEPSTPGPAGAVADHDAVWPAVLSLPPRQRAVVVLRFYEDLTEAQTGGCSAWPSGRSRATAMQPARRWPTGSSHR